MNNTPSSKAVAAGITATVLSGALVAVAIWWVKQHYGLDVPQSVQDNLVVIVAAALGGIGTLLAAWLKPENRPSPSAVATVKRRGLA